MSENIFMGMTDHELFKATIAILSEEVPLSERAIMTLLWLIDTEEKEVRFLEWMADHVKLSAGPIPYTEADLEMIANDINQGRPPRDLEKAREEIRTRIAMRKKQ